MNTERLPVLLLKLRNTVSSLPCVDNFKRHECRPFGNLIGGV